MLYVFKGFQEKFFILLRAIWCLNNLIYFRVFDRDDNGYITRDELRSALEMIGEPVTDAQLNQVLALGDIDHDGRIDYEGVCDS